MIEEHWWVVPVLIVAYVLSWYITKPLKGDVRAFALVFLVSFASLLVGFLILPWFGDFGEGLPFGKAFVGSIALAFPIAFSIVVRFPEEKPKPAEDAFDDGDVERIQEMLESDPEIVHQRGHYEETPLHWAARRGDVEMIDLLLSNGAEVDAVDRDNHETPLNWAACKGQTEAVRALVDGGADVNARNKDGETALHWAAHWGHEETVEALLHRRAEVSAEDSHGRTPLVWALAEDREQIARLLKRHGAVAGLNRGANGDDRRHGISS